MKSAHIDVDPHRTVGTVDGLIYGHFLESNFFGNIEGGVFDEGSPLALGGDGPENGLRRDVIEVCRQLGLPIVRWPGGNFASAYHWQDGIGPRAQRPRRLELAWHGEESNRFGTDEFLAWCAAVGTEPYLVNSCRDIDEAVHWLEYTNSTADTAYARMRPHKAPVRYWGIGNEVYGDWQVGHRSAARYADDAREHATFLRAVDPSVRLIGVGNDREEWLRPLLHRAGRLLDYVSLHVYGASTHLFTGAAEVDEIAAQALYFEERIEATARLIESLAGEAGLSRTPAISLDEWNMRHLEPTAWPEPAAGANGGTADREICPDAPTDHLRVNRWSTRTMADALFYAGVFHALHRLSGMAAAPKMANTVNLINANAPIQVRTTGVVRTPTYHVWDLYQNHLGRTVLAAEVESPARRKAIRQGDNRLPGGGFDTRGGVVPTLDVVATRSADGVQIAAINRDHDTVGTTIRIGGAPAPAHAHVRDIVADVLAVNSLDQPDAVRLTDRGVQPAETYQFPPFSVSLLSYPA